MDNKEFQINLENVGNKIAMKKYKSIERGALLRGITFSITYQEYLKFYEKPCFYCGVSSIGLDRIDSVLGYKLDNVVTCCAICNMMKASLDQAGFLNHCRRIAFIHFGDNDSENIIPHSGNTGNLIWVLKDKERQLIIDLLTEKKGNRVEVSKALGISTTTLWRKIKSHRISSADLFH